MAMDDQAAKRLMAKLDPWRSYVSNTGGNPIEELLTDTTAVQINAPRALIAVAAKVQVQLLKDLLADGLLVNPRERAGR
jgi:hypothetical protein